MPSNAGISYSIAIFQSKQDLSDASIPSDSARARRLGVDALYSEKGHFMAARIWKSISYFIAIPSTICAAAAGASFFKGKHGELAGWLAVAASALTGLGEAINPSDRASRHHRAGVLYAATRRKIRDLVQVEALLRKEDEQLHKKLQELTTQISKLQGESPAIFAWAYRRAKKSIDRGCADYTEAELNAATGELQRPPKHKWLTESSFLCMPYRPDSQACRVPPGFGSSVPQNTSRCPHPSRLRFLQAFQFSRADV